jgi:uncharacterized membrane protein YuzA (DUF378 family)
MTDPNRPTLNPANCDQEPSSCGGHCPGCKQDHGAPGYQVPGGLEGGRLAIAAAGAFLAPLLAAVVGAIVAGPSARTIGAIVGLAGGVAVMALVAHLVNRHGKHNPTGPADMAGPANHQEQTP